MKKEVYMNTVLNLIRKKINKNDGKFRMVKGTNSKKYFLQKNILKEVDLER